MDFELSEEQKMIQSLARDFVTSELRPLERDLLGQPTDHNTARAYLDETTETALISKARETGLWGASVPEELGGVGLGTLANCLIEEELAQTIVPFNFGDVTPILFECNEPQRQAYFEPALNHSKLPYLALMEPEKNDLPKMTTRATTVEDGYILNGIKTVISRPWKDYFGLVFALAGADARPTCFLIDRETTGFEVNVISDNNRSPTATLLVTLRDCRVPRENRLGDEGKAFSLGKKWLPARRVIRAARSVGICRRLLEESVVRAQNWQAFGRAVADQPAIQVALAEIAAGIHACQLMVFETAWKADNNDDIRPEASMVKLMAGKLVRETLDATARVYGGPPYSDILPLKRLYQNAMADFAIDLSAELQSRIVTRDIFKGLKV